MFFDSKTTIITKVIIMHSKTKTFFTIIYSFSNQIMTTIVYLIFKQLGMSSGCYSMVVEKNNCIQPNERAMNGLNNQWWRNNRWGFSRWCKGTWLVTLGLDLKRVDFQAKIYWTTCHLRLFLLFDIPHLWIVIVQQGGAQVKILGVEEIGDLVQGNTARPPRVMGRNKPSCRRGKFLFGNCWCLIFFHCCECLISNKFHRSCNHLMSSRFSFLGAQIFIRYHLCILKNSDQIWEWRGKNKLFDKSNEEVQHMLDKSFPC